MNTTEEKLVSAMSGLVGIQQYLVGLPERETQAEQILKSDQYKAFSENKSAAVSIELKTAITRTSAVNDPVVPSFKPGVDAGVRRTLSVRDLLREYPIQQGAVEMPICSGKTINATGQVAGSPEQAENVTLPESALTFTNSFMPVVTYSHFVPVSSQLMEDSGQFQAFIDGELRHGLALGIEDGLINHTGTTGLLNGLLNNATAYTLQSPQLTGESEIIRDALRQIEAADFVPDAIIVNPADWYSIDMQKASATDDTYTAGGVRLITGKTLWGIPVVVSNSIAAGTFLVGDFARCGALFSRQGANVQMSRADSDNFQSNMVTVKAQERLAWVTTNSTALVKGSL